MQSHGVDTEHFTRVNTEVQGTRPEGSGEKKQSVASLSDLDKVVLDNPKIHDESELKVKAFRHQSAANRNIARNANAQRAYRTNAPDSKNREVLQNEEISRNLTMDNGSANSSAHHDGTRTVETMAK